MGYHGAMLCECDCGLPAPIAQRTNAAKNHVKGQPVRFIRGHSSADVRSLISEAKRGHAVDEATRVKISATLTGRSDSAEIRAKKLAAARRGDASPVWVGADASYTAVHTRARLALTGECAHADSTCKGMLEAALRHGLPDALVRVSRRGHRYYVGETIEDGYLRLCRSHHRRYDR